MRPPATTETELWFRNPHSYIRECVIAGVRNTIWDRSLLRRLAIDPQRHAIHFYPAAQDFTTAAIGDQGMAVMDRQHGIGNPKAVYPVWQYGANTIETLEQWTATDCTEELRDRALAAGRPIDEIPVLGQRHLVAVAGLPNLTTGVGRKFFLLLEDLQHDYPHCTLHVSGTEAWASLFGRNIRSGDLNPRASAAKGFIMLPNGRTVTMGDVWRHRKWLDLIGCAGSDLREPRNRCLFNIQAARWAAKNWDSRQDFELPTAPLGPVGLAALINGRNPERLKPRRRATRRRSQRNGRPLGPNIGDKLYCGACSYANSCRQYREGSVCSVAGTDASKLAELFNSRNSDRIIEGLGLLIETDLERLDEGRQNEVADGELDPHVTKLGDNLFRHGTALAKLVDPRLRSAAVAINLNAGPAQRDEDATPQALAANAVAALEQGGVPRDQISAEMVMKCMAADGDDTGLELIIAAEAAKYALPSAVFEVPAEDVEVVDP